MLDRSLSRIIVLAIGIPPLFLLDPGVDVDVFGLLESFETLASELAADAAPLLAAEWGGVVVREGVVDPDGTGPDLTHTPKHLLQVACVDVRPKPERDGVGKAYRLVKAVYPNYRDDWPEGLLAHHAHRRLDTRQHGRLVEETTLPPPLAASDERGAVVERLPDVTL